MATLTVEQKREIVTALACFKRPAEVAVMMKEHHDLDLEIKQIVKYDPSRATWEGADDLRTIFDVARKAYLEDVNSIPIASQSFRLNELMGNYETAKKKGNLVLANQILEQAAKEIGGVLTNERNLKVEKTGSLAELTPEERRNMAAEMLRDVLSKAPEQTAPSSEAVQ
jgi:hypothetical protein